MTVAGNPPRVMRIMQLHLSADWEGIWTHLQECWTTEAVKINWYVVMQDILPTNERLHKIRLRHYGETDTVQQSNRMRRGGEDLALDQRRLAWILRTDPAHLPPD